jgi:hypothetical protein
MRKQIQSESVETLNFVNTVANTFVNITTKTNNKQQQQQQQQSETCTKHHKDGCAAI